MGWHSVEGGEEMEAANLREQERLPATHRMYGVGLHTALLHRQLPVQRDAAWVWRRVIAVWKPCRLLGIAVLRKTQRRRNWLLKAVEHHTVDDDG